MTTSEPAWKKFLKLKSDVPVAAANLADNVGLTGIKRKREALPPQKPAKSILKQSKNSANEVAEKKAKTNKQKKKAKTKTKRSRKDEADSKAAQSAALEYLSLYCSARGEWKFSKPRQNYLIKHVYNVEMMPEDRFDSLLTYLQGLQGGAKQRVLETAEELVKRYERQEAPESAGTTDKVETAEGDENDQESEQEEEDITTEQLDRAKQVRTKLMDQAASEKDDGTSDSSSESDA